MIGKWKWHLVAIYLFLLAASYVVRWTQRTEVSVPPELSTVTVHAIKTDSPTTDTVRLAFREYKTSNPHAAVILLIHGSPGGERDFRKLAPLLAKDYRVIVPDLPGFGFSSHDVPDYSNRAHAHYILELLDQLNVQRANLVGFSMGGGVVLNAADIAPERIASIIMLSGIGVQEMELLGNYHLNHSIHAVQLGYLWFTHNAFPHFGWFDHSMLSLEYARNFYDTDQRPLRRILSEYAGPMLIIHGDNDMMVPVEVAREDYRLVPQSELHLIANENHFYLFSRPTQQAEWINEFVARVEAGQATTRARATPERVELSKQPFNPAAAIPRAMGPTALVIFALLALATLISEDLTCVWAGVMVAEGRVGFAFGAIACLFGIFVGDILLFLAGRFIGRAAVRHAPLKWVVSEADVERGSAWFRRRGMITIFISRFMPGTRLPTYVAAGLLDTSFLRFTFYFLIAAAIWTPLLVAASMIAGREIIESAILTQQSLFMRAALIAIALFVAIRLLLQLTTFRGRRLLVGRWRRWTQWEFWPLWLFYPPVLGYILYLGLKFRCLTLFTCANPAIEEGGFVGESKSKILAGLQQQAGSHDFLPVTGLLKLNNEANKTERALQFMHASSLEFPVVLKPDAGERGSGVSVIRSERELADYLAKSPEVDLIIQQYVSGLEFGVFYYRYPSETRGHIFAITEKLFPTVIGDGNSTLETLILKDKRAVSIARVYFNALGDRLWDVPAAGESVQLIEIGTHCRGSIFLDGTALRTEAMETAIDRAAEGFSGFFFGRFDIRTTSLPDFQDGRNFKVIELNGVTSEATSIYDPKNSLLEAYRVLFQQWRIAFEIGAENRLRGVKPASLRRLASLALKKWRHEGERSGANLRLSNQEVAKPITEV